MSLNLNQILQNKLLAQLKQKNPQAYQFIEQAKANGKQPGDLINELSQNGMFTQAQIQQAQAQANSMLNSNANGTTNGAVKRDNPLRR